MPGLLQATATPTFPALQAHPHLRHRSLDAVLRGAFDDDVTVEAVWAIYEHPFDSGNLRVWLTIDRDRDASEMGLQLAESLERDGIIDDYIDAGDSRYIMASFKLSAELIHAARGNIDALDLLMGEGNNNGDGLMRWRFEGRSSVTPAFPNSGSIIAVVAYRRGELSMLWSVA